MTLNLYFFYRKYCFYFEIQFGKDLPKILPSPDSRSTVVLAFRKAHILKGYDPQIVNIPAMGDHEANVIYYIILYITKKP